MSFEELFALKMILECLSRLRNHDPTTVVTELGNFALSIVKGLDGYEISSSSRRRNCKGRRRSGKWVIHQRDRFATLPSRLTVTRRSLWKTILIPENTFKFSPLIISRLISSLPWENFWNQVTLGRGFFMRKNKERKSKFPQKDKSSRKRNFTKYTYKATSDISNVEK